MRKKNTRRLVAGASTAALAVGFAASFGVGAASAAPVNQSTNSGSWTFNRTISNGTPAPGETITVTNAIRWNGGLAPTISAFRDFHPSCLTYVAGSSRVAGSTVTTNAADPNFVSMTGSWIRSAVNRNIDYTLNYTVGANCGRDLALTTGTGISANQSTGSENQTAGPSLTVPKSASTASVAVSPAPQVGAATTLTATVTAGATGTVEFADNGTVLGTGTVNNGTATYSWTPGAAQPYSITAKYLGDATFAQSTSAAKTGTVTPAPTAPAAPTDLAANPATVTAGGTVSVSGKAEANSNVTVTAGGKTCTATADGAGNFACDIVTDAVGTLTVTAVAANNVGTSPVSAPISVEVNATATTTDLAVAPAPQVDAATTLTATVSAGATGDVEFANNGTVLGTGTVNNGTATYSWTPGAADSDQAYSITAKYLGDATHAQSTSAPQTGTVTPAPTAPGAPTDLAANPATVTVGGTVTVSGKAEANSNVTVTAGGKTCTATADGAGNFSCDIVTDAAGTLTVTAVAANNIGTGPVSAPISVEVNATATTTDLAVAPAPQVDAASTLTATVSAGATGTVEFADNGTVLGTGTIDNGTATYSWTPTAAQPYSITAKYLGDATHAQSTSAPQTGTVTAAPTAPGAPTNLAANPATVTAGGTVTITGKAEADSNVTVTAGDKTCTATADGTGNFACDITTDAAGTLTVTAVAANNIGSSPASAPISVDVTAAPTAPGAPTNLAANPATVTAGGTVTITGKAEADSNVTVTAGSKTCTATADAAGNFACDITTDAAGTLTVTAVAANNIGSSPASAPISVDVTAAPTAPGAPTNLAANPATVTVGSTVTITGKAEADSNVTVTAGSKTCTATTDGAGNFACDIVTDAAGTLTVTAVAANNIGTSPASAPISVEVTEVQSGTAVISVTPAALTAGTEATITVTGADAGTPVTVKVGTTTVCTTTVAADGTASCQWIPAAGAQTLTAEVVVDGTATTVTKAVTVAPEGNPGDGAGSLSNLFGS
ncbi:Ig-like domain repeat protein [Rhodococcus sp. Q]|uniref:beta strand repeat-containing protein n=1 Tax=Rhodococcus sp. Q TaxID=2502252 RepID=UPI0010F9606E|nr:Ig-like domain repeat protein [Rhodococcus sp. Q]